MTVAVNRGPWARAFTLIELIVVIVVLAILSGVAIPKYFDYANNAKISSTKGILGGVRSAVANFYANQAVSGTARYPTLVELQTVGTVMQETMPPSPFGTDPTTANTIVAATYPVDPVATPPPVSGTAGWNYDVAKGKFWCNSSTSSANTW
jgi:prepilin-type N-terminal cleavage/methylation domain-containing protein